MTQDPWRRPESPRYTWGEPPVPYSGAAQQPTPGRASTPHGVGWRVRHSAWLLAVLLGMGLFCWVGFAYCAVRTRDPRWRVPLVGFLLASLPGWLMTAAWTRPNGDLTTGAESYVLCMWAAATLFGLYTAPEYLRWRAAREQQRW